MVLRLRPEFWQLVVIKKRRSELRVPVAFQPWLWCGNRASDIRCQARAAGPGDVFDHLNRLAFLSPSIFRFRPLLLIGSGLHVARKPDFPVRLGVLMVSKAAKLDH